ncbi:uncharacterized protein EI97DRAFT_397220 [Westerdykella ornata]|uniref:Uncharacterized protein n=1 Tax=Westerdykella ornata TaxID=318751 RepID=A0A6A6JM59_WESOR|nr:uncharacterized protein EI97DRAFT_397220 [Westerdykella ornata]KAF2277203.1 hypothetical protein EI97DRAFT_397220 [Westerdykella ornata]
MYVSTLLFCVAEDAKPFIHRILDGNYLCLVQSCDVPSDPTGFKTQLKEGEDFETEFIGASQEDCQKWTREKSAQVNFINPYVLVIADERTARDGTISAQFYSEGMGKEDEEMPLEFPGYGVLPPKSDTWYDYRIDPKAFFRLSAALDSTAIDVAYPIYYGRKDELTDENGVFDVIKAFRTISEGASAFQCLYNLKNRDTGIWER